MFRVLLPALGAVANAGYYITTQRLLHSIDRHVLAGGSFLATGILLFFIAIISGIPPLSDDLFFRLPRHLH